MTLDTFKTHLQGTAGSGRTVLAYMADAGRFENYRASRPVTMDLYEAWVGTLEALRPQTVTKKRTAVHRWLAYRGRHGDEEAARTLGILAAGYRVGRRVRERDVEPVEPVTEIAYRDALGRAPVWGRYLMMLLWSSGARISEVIGDDIAGIPALTIGQGAELVEVGHTGTWGKGGRKRTLVVSTSARNGLRPWVEGRLRNLLPFSSSGNLPNRSARNLKPECKMTRALPGRQQGTNDSNLLGGQSMIAPSTLGRHVSDILGLSSEEQMSGVHTGRSVASVQDAHILRDGTAGQFPGDPVSQTNLAVLMNSPVPPTKTGGSPQPALGRSSNFDLGPEYEHVLKLPLFPSPVNTGSPVTSRGVNDMIHRAGLQHGAHALRHSYKARLRQAGVREEIVRTLLGHGPKTTTDHYGKVTVAEMLEAAEKLGGGEAVK